jgi:hypothetical protein
MGRPGLCIYVPQEEDSPVIPPGTVFPCSAGPPYITAAWSTYKINLQQFLSCCLQPVATGKFVMPLPCNGSPSAPLFQHSGIMSYYAHMNIQVASEDRMNVDTPFQPSYSVNDISYSEKC